MEKTGQIFLADIGIPSLVYDWLTLGSRPDFTVSQDALIEVK